MKSAYTQMATSAGTLFEPVDSVPVLGAVPHSVLHLVGRITETVFSFLGPATEALAQHGFVQTIVLIDDPLYRHLLEKFHPSVQLVPVNADAAGADLLKELLDAYCDTARVSRPAVAHLHGLVCSVIGLYASRVHNLDVPTYFTPHGSKSLVPLLGLGAAMPWILRPLSGRLGDRVIANNRFDASSLREITHRAVHLIESPVAPVFFATVRRPPEAPMVMTGQHAPNPVGAALYGQCAVLLSHQVPGLRFGWAGTFDEESAAQLRAAHVELLDLTDDAKRAAQLASATVFLAPEGGKGFPVFMAEAMAMGVPCVAWDTPYHRDLLRDGDNGFLCADIDAALQRVAELLESPALQERIGNAARIEAQTRFDSARFRNALLGVYGADASELPSATSTRAAAGHAP